MIALIFITVKQSVEIRESRNFLAYLMLRLATANYSNERAGSVNEPRPVVKYLSSIFPCLEKADKTLVEHRPPSPSANRPLWFC